MVIQQSGSDITFYPALVLFEQENCFDWINVCYILSLTET